MRVWFAPGTNHKRVLRGCQHHSLTGHASFRYAKARHRHATVVTKEQQAVGSVVRADAYLHLAHHGWFLLPLVAKAQQHKSDVMYVDITTSPKYFWVATVYTR